MHSMRSSTPDPDEPNGSMLDAQEGGSSRRHGMSMGVHSLDDDDPNILLAIQLSLQDSGLTIDEETREFHGNNASLGAIGSSLPTRLDPVPINIDTTRTALSSSELLELGDSLIRLGAGTELHATDRLRLPPFSDIRSGFYSTSIDANSCSQDLNINENLIGNIMAWFHDINPQSIALIPSTATETDEDSEQQNTEEHQRYAAISDEGQNVQEEHALFEDALLNEGRETHIEEIVSQPNVNPTEIVLHSDDYSCEASSNVSYSEDVSSQTPQTASEWLEQVHLV